MSGSITRPLPQHIRWLHSLIGLTLACLALAASGSAWADPPGRVGRIADTSGNVWLFDDEEGDWIQPGRNRPVTAGDTDAPLTPEERKRLDKLLREDT